MDWTSAIFLCFSVIIYVLHIDVVGMFVDLTRGCRGSVFFSPETRLWVVSWTRGVVFDLVSHFWSTYRSMKGARDAANQMASLSTKLLSCRVHIFGSLQMAALAPPPFSRPKYCIGDSRRFSILFESLYLIFHSPRICSIAMYVTPDTRTRKIIVFSYF